MKKRVFCLFLALTLAFGVCVPTAAAENAYYSDTKRGAWYYDAVQWATDAGVVEGYPDGSFGVGRACTEQEAIVMLWRAAGRVETGSGTTDSDKAMSWLARQTGATLDFVKPDVSITRAAFTAVLYVALGDFADIPAEMPFTDLGNLEETGGASFSEAALRWAYAKGLIEGVTETKFAPMQQMTREQVVTLLKRCFEKELPYTVTEKEIPAYIISTEFSIPLTFSFLDGQMDIPYLSVQELQNFLQTINTVLFEAPDYKLTLTVEDDRVMLTRENGFPMILDFDTDTISFVDYDTFLRPASDGSILDAFNATEYDADGNPAYFKLLDTSSERYGKALTLALGAYGLRLIRQNDGYYIPFQTVNDFLVTPKGINFLYNGEMCVFSPDEELEAMIYSVPTGARSTALALFTYKELCMALDHLYGLKEQHNIRSFPEEFEMDGLKADLLSTDPAVSDAALAKLTYYFLDDSHSGFGSPSYLEGPEITWDMQIGASVTDLLLTRSRLSAARSAAFPEGVPGYQEVGNTAYITFDNFNIGQTDYYQTPPDETTTDTIGLMIYAYSQITREGSPVKNVVLDLSLNGGGVVFSAAYVIGTFLGKGSISTRNTMTDALVTQNYLVDLNLDRVFDEKDSLLDYNLFCIASSFSFSCGNLVPNVFKSSHRVTLLGQTSGGGACEVLYMTTADGARFQISGPYCLSFLKNGSFYDIDQGAVPDHVINDYAHYYDREALTKYINGLF